MAIDVPGCLTTESGGYRLSYAPDLDPRAVIQSIRSPGEILKRSSKSETRRVGDWVVKHGLFEGGLGPLKRTVAPHIYRRAWVAANYLYARGIHTPTPMAYYERVRFGIVLDNAMVTQYLDGFVNVEVYAKGLAPGQPEALDAFFSSLASAVNRLPLVDVYHADLSGKNIFTKDGGSFYFIDLDSVVIGQAYSPNLRLKNQVQLYDSFCDYCSEETLVRFHERMTPNPDDFPNWMQAVKAGQLVRRNRHKCRQKPQ